MNCATYGDLWVATLCILLPTAVVTFIALALTLDKVLNLVRETHTILTRLAPFMGILGTTDEAMNRMDQASQAYLNQVRNQNRRKK